MRRSRKVIYASSENSEDETKDHELTTRKIWNYKINDLVQIKETKNIGLIIATSIYKSKRISSNTFIVLLNNKIVTLEGKQFKLLYKLKLKMIV